jgi:hypothetical protein
MAYTAPELALVGQAVNMVLGPEKDNETFIYSEGLDETYSDVDLLAGKEQSW